MPSARLATGGDLGQIMAIAELVGGTMSEQRGASLFFRREGAEGVDLKGLADGFEDNSRHLVVGEFYGCILGYGVAHVERLATTGIGVVDSEAELSEPMKIGRLDAFAVDPGARGIGIGEAMMNALADALRLEGCAAIESYALPGDRNTKNFFEGFGMKARLLTVSKLL